MKAFFYRKMLCVDIQPYINFKIHPSVLLYKNDFGTGLGHGVWEGVCQVSPRQKTLFKPFMNVFTAHIEFLPIPKNNPPYLCRKNV
jgi:hypothetical protein